jgi:hypothetical protein
MFIFIGTALMIHVGVLSTNLPRGYPKVVDCSVGGRQTWSLMVKARTQDTDLDRFGPPEYRNTLCSF